MSKTILRPALAACLLLGALSAAATVNVAATTSNLGMLARTIGGDAVKVTVLARPIATLISCRPSRA